MKTNAMLVMVLSGCAVSSHPSMRGTMGKAGTVNEAVARLAEPGPIELETVVAADWEVPLSGVINLKHPVAKDAGLVDRPEPIQIFFHVVRHPDAGTFVVDTGLERALRDAPSASHVSGLMRTAMKPETVKFVRPLADWLAEGHALDGVFFTHAHLDHLNGLADVPRDTPLFTGPGELQSSALMHALTRGGMDDTLRGRPSVQEWPFERLEDGAFEGAVDVFGDGSMWALWAPGHTPGSTVYLVRTTSGPVLLIGDVSHTRWGWEHDVEPGTYSEDGARSTQTFKKVKAFVAAHPELEMRFGHQR